MLQKVIFIHIPKTAGYTTSRRLKEASALVPNKDILPEKFYGFSHGLAKNLIKPEDWKYPVVAIVRNPYDRLHSMWSWSQQHVEYEIEVPWEEFVLSYEEKYRHKTELFYTCYEFIEKNDKIIATDLLRFENVAVDYENLCKKYDIRSSRSDLRVDNVNPFKKVLTEQGRKELYTDEMREVVERVFRKDLILFRYTYERFVKEEPI